MFQPRHTHPFSPEEALLLDPPTITAEVARLRHSVDHLRQSNDALRDFLAAEGFDREIATARDENERTIASQHERIAILQWALARHVGAPSAGHYAGDALIETDDTPYEPSAMVGGHQLGPARTGPPPGLEAVGFGGQGEGVDGRQALTTDDEAERRPAEVVTSTSTSTGRPSRPLDPAGEEGSRPPVANGDGDDDDDGVHL